MIAILSDIHGNFPALKAVFTDLETYSCKKIFSLGDVGGYYCMINECIEFLQEHNVQNIMGNHDFYLTAGHACPRSTSANQCLDYQRKIIKQENLEWLRKSPLFLKYGAISMVHGGWNDPLDEYLMEIPEDYFAQRDGTFFFSGHTHSQRISYFKNKVYCNPGSVGQPRDGNSRAAYALLDENTDKIILRRVPYAIDNISKNMEEAGFSSYFYENLYNGLSIGGKILKL